MSRFLFYVMNEPGHLYPTVPVAKKLMKRGHDVAYASQPSAEGLIKGQGINFFPIEPDINYSNLLNLTSA